MRLCIISFYGIVLFCLFSCKSSFNTKKFYPVYDGYSVCYNGNNGTIHCFKLHSINDKANTFKRFRYEKIGEQKFELSKSDTVILTKSGVIYLNDTIPIQILPNKLKIGDVFKINGKSMKVARYHREIILKDQKFKSVLEIICLNETCDRIYLSRGLGFIYIKNSNGLEFLIDMDLVNEFGDLFSN